MINIKNIVLSSLKIDYVNYFQKFQNKVLNLIK